MLWSFIAVCLSAWLFVDASYRGPAWQRWVFKPLTLLLLALLAWQAPMFNAVSYLVLAGLLASLLGDALTLLPRQRLLYAVGAFFLSHLLYIKGKCAYVLDLKPGEMRWVDDMEDR